MKMEYICNYRFLQWRMKDEKERMLGQRAYAAAAVFSGRAKKAERVCTDCPE